MQVAFKQVHCAFHVVVGQPWGWAELEPQAKECVDVGWGCSVGGKVVEGKVCRAVKVIPTLELAQVAVHIVVCGGIDIG